MRPMSAISPLESIPMNLPGNLQSLWSALQIKNECETIVEPRFADHDKGTSGAEVPLHHWYSRCPIYQDPIKSAEEPFRTVYVGRSGSRRRGIGSVKWAILSTLMVGLPKAGPRSVTARAPDHASEGMHLDLMAMAVLFIRPAWTHFLKWSFESASGRS